MNGVLPEPLSEATEGGRQRRQVQTPGSMEHPVYPVRLATRAEHGALLFHCAGPLAPPRLGQGRDSGKE